jgi:flagellin-like protein
MIKKAEMGIGTLVLFIAFILVAAIAASVLLSNTTTLRNKALKTSKATIAEVGTSLSNAQLYGEDGSDSKIEYLYYTIKVSSGSAPIRFQDSFLTVNLNNVSVEYTYANLTTVNCSIKDATNSASIYNETKANRFGLDYLLKSGQYTAGYLFPGSVVTLCFKAPRQIREQEKFEMKMVLKEGATLELKTQTPPLMTTNRVYVFP